MGKKLYKIVVKIWDDLNLENIDENTLNFLIDNQYIVESQYHMEERYEPNPNLSIRMYYELLSLLISPNPFSLTIDDNNEMDLKIHSSRQKQIIYYNYNSRNYDRFTKVLKEDE